MKCPDCSSEIAQADVNMAKDILMCRKCNKFFSISTDVMKEPPSKDYSQYYLDVFEAQRPPSGAWIQEEADGSILVGTNMRAPLAIFFVVFSLIWDIGALTMASALFTGQESDREALFMLPFFASVAVFTTLIAIFMLFGKTEVRINHASAEVFMGLASIGWRKDFDWREVRNIKEGWSNFRVNNSRQKNIIIENAKSKEINFGSLLSDPKRLYIMKVLLKYHILFKQKGL